MKTIPIDLPAEVADEYLVLLTKRRNEAAEEVKLLDKQIEKIRHQTGSLSSHLKFSITEGQLSFPKIRVKRAHSERKIFVQLQALNGKGAKIQELIKGAATSYSTTYRVLHDLAAAGKVKKSEDGLWRLVH